MQFSSEKPPADERVRSRSRRLTRGAVAGIVLGCLAVMPGLRWQADTDQLREGRQTRSDVVDVAVSSAGLLLSLDGDSASSTLDRLGELSTGDFADQVDTLRDTVAGVLREGDVDSSGEIAAAGVERLTSTSAVVLIAATSLVSNAEIPAGELRTFRMAVQLSRVDEEWKVSHVEFLT